MNVRTLCLAILNAGESTGYEIRKLSTDGHYSFFVDASFGSIYPALNRLENDGMVTSREETQSGKPSKKVYSVTPAGRAEFIDALSKPVQPDIFKSEFMLIAMCAECMQPEDLSNTIDAHLTFLKGELQKIDDAELTVELEGAHWVADLGRSCLNASLDYINKNRAQIEAVAGKKLPGNDFKIAAE